MVTIITHDGSMLSVALPRRRFAFGAAHGRSRFLEFKSLGEPFYTFPVMIFGFKTVRVFLTRVGHDLRVTATGR